MKRFEKMLLVIALVFALAVSAVMATAAANAPTITVENVNTMPGETV